MQAEKAERKLRRGNMDFSTQYTAEQEDFRKEVQAWIEANVPEDKKSPVDPEGLTSGQEGDNADLYWFWREKHKELAEKGWLYPTYPKEYGGGGLGGEHETIIEEEFSKGGVVRGFTNGLVFPTLLVWGTEEQKQKFLTPLLKAETVAFQNFTEPNAGSDLASLQSRASRDGDDWIISGQKQFVSGAGVPDILFGPMVTDPDAPRHRNLGFFLIENPSDGLQIGRMGLLGGSRQNRIFMDNVRVSGENLVGGDHQGWQVTQTTLEQEHGGRGQAFPRDEALENLMDYVKNTDHGDGKVGSDPVVRQKTMDSVLSSHINTLFAKRNFAMYQARQEMSYHGSQSSMYGKTYRLDNALRQLDIMGPKALLGTEEPDAPFGGHTEVNQRTSLQGLHPGGTVEVQKVIIARRIGISRTQERAAPTPATATQHGS
jgi:alkylation response protein AidB-like acyl-CoA dehydrogenase